MPASDLLDYPPEPFRICDDASEQERIDILQDIAVRGSEKTGISDLAKIVWARIGSRKTPENAAAEALNAIHHLEYHPHPPGEWFSSVPYTLAHGGNCEDLSSTLVALLLHLGLKAQVAWVTQDDKPLNHVAVQVNLGGTDTGWLWADPSIAGARVGETPYQALERIAPTLHPADLEFRAKRKYTMRQLARTRAAGDIRTNVPSETVTIKAPEGGAPLATGSVRFIGGTAVKTVPPSTVSIVIDTMAPQIVTVNDDGNWSLSAPAPGLPLPDGTHSIKATVGAVTHEIIVDVGAPVSLTPIQILSPASGELSAPLTTISGKGTPNTPISVSIDGNSAWVTSVAAGADGTWSAPLSAAAPTPARPGLPATLSPGPHRVDAAGAGSATVSVNFVVPQTAQSTPTGSVSFMAPPNGSTHDSLQTVSGRGPAGGTVMVSLDAGPSTSLTIDSFGLWALTFAHPLPAGQHSVTATVGTSSATTTFTVRAGLGTAVPVVAPVSGVPAVVTSEPGIPTWVWALGGAAVAVFIWQYMDKAGKTAGKTEKSR